MQLTMNIPHRHMVGPIDRGPVESVPHAILPPLLAPIGMFDSGLVKSVLLVMKVPLLMAIGINNSRTTEAVALALDIPPLEAIFAHNRRTVQTVQFVSMVDSSFPRSALLIRSHSSPIHGIGNNAGTFEGIDKVPSHDCRVYHLVCLYVLVLIFAPINDGCQT